MSKLWSYCRIREWVDITFDLSDYKPNAKPMVNYSKEEIKQAFYNKLVIYMFGIPLAGLIGVFVILAVGSVTNTVRDTFNNHTNNTPTVTASQTQGIPQSSINADATTSTSPALQSPQNASISDIDTPSYELCSVRLINTLHGTDKTGAYKAVMIRLQKH